MSKQILIVDDDELQRMMLANLIHRKLGLEKTIHAENGRKAIDLLAKNSNSVGLIVLDMNMPVMNGLETLTVLKEKYPHIPVIMLTGNASLNDVVTAMKAGATDFIAKPYQGERIIITIQNCLKLGTLTEELTRLKREKDGTFCFENMVGWDGGLESCVTMGKKAAKADIPVLITGATGSGKEIFAHAIHGESNRAGRAFIAVNCGAIPAQLVESTLFGHEKGAFTGATEKTIGKFREADGGTIFLDEVGELPLETQVKLLRVLQQKEVEPVGAGRPVHVNVRILSATNRNLEQEVSKGNFREDLYFRLNVLQIELPELAKRKEDIPELALHFVNRFCAQEGLPAIHVPQKTLDYLISKDWQGNVRELENAINRALVMRDRDEILPEHFIMTSAAPRTEEKTPDTRHHLSYINSNGDFKTMDEIEQDAMKHALEYCNGNTTAAAKLLGIAKSTFYRKINLNGGVVSNGM